MENSIKILARMSDYCVPKSRNAIKPKNQGNQMFKDWHLIHFVQTKETWEEIGMGKGMLSTKMIHGQHTVQDEQIITGVPIEIQA